MIFKQSVLGLIPARGGSKRLPGKNLKKLCGEPLINWTIAAAKQSHLIDTIAVSTDDQAIVDAVRGVHVIDRPSDLAEDHSLVYDAIFHALDELPPFDWICLLQPTSPLREADDIDACIYACHSQQAPACVSTTYGRPDANGAVYVAWVSWLRETRLFDSGRTVTHRMPPERSVDIDTMEDFRNAERLLSLRRSGR